MDNLSMKIEATINTDDLFKDSVSMLCEYFNVDVTVDNGQLQFKQKDGFPIKYINISNYVDVKIK